MARTIRRTARSTTSARFLIAYRMERSDAALDPPVRRGWIMRIPDAGHRGPFARPVRRWFTSPDSVPDLIRELLDDPEFRGGAAGADGAKTKGGAR